jgi:hypothetical protein
MVSFKVDSTLDLSGITDADLADTRKGSGSSTLSKTKLLRTPGTYDFTLTDRRILEPRVDGAGRKWGNMALTLTENESGDLVKSFIDYPIESAVYTSATGNPSTVKTKIFSSLMSSILGRKITVSDLPAVTADIEDSLSVGSQLNASVTFKGDHIVRNVADNGVITFGIQRGVGDLLTDGQGETLVFDSYEAATNYYTQVNNRKPKQGMEVSGYNMRAALKLRKVV